MNVMELSEDLTDVIIEIETFIIFLYFWLQIELQDKKFAKSKIANMTTDYSLRTYTAGCYYLDEKYEEWTGKNLRRSI